MKKENILAAIMALTVLAVVNLPIMYFSLVAKNGLVFLGRRVINSQETYNQIALIEQAKQGRVVFENLYTTESQNPYIFQPSYLVIGRLARLLNVSSLFAYHTARIVLSLIFVVVLFIFLSKIFTEGNVRLLAFAILLTSSGLGFLLQNIIPQSTDLGSVAESNTFQSLADAPHVILSQILILGGFMLLLKYIKSKRIFFVLPMSLLFFLLSLEYPESLPVVGFTVIITCLFSGLSIFEAICLCVASSLGIIYQTLITHNNSVLQALQTQNKFFSPAPITYLCGFGIIAALSLCGLESYIRKKSPTKILILAWIFSGTALLYSPLTFQTRLVNGLHIPIAIAATSGLLVLISKLKQEYLKRVIIILTLSILPITSIYIISHDFGEINKDNINIYHYYISKPEYEGLIWLKNNTVFNDIILSNTFYGNIIPGLTGRKVYIGYATQTISWKNKIEAGNNFLFKDDAASSVKFLSDNKITYIFLGNSDSNLIYGFRPDSKLFLSKVYDKDGVLIYKFKK